MYYSVYSVVLFLSNERSGCSNMVIVGKIYLYVHNTFVTRKRTKASNIQKDEVFEIRSSIFLSVLL